MLEDRVGVPCGPPSPVAVPLLHCSWGQTGLPLGSSGTAEKPLPAAQEGAGLGPGEAGALHCFALGSERTEEGLGSCGG